ncbi:uncharacterized protein C4orf54 homolog [Anguilla rostrata]|uniref:uncharacterized protein C4orf54 homolog n=1 Tax=Anguilla rostrata TaxID=7938 RepID=UPI0030CA7E15
MKLLPGKDLYNYGTQDESSYVELDNVLDMKSEGTRTLKVMLAGDSNQLGIFKCKGDAPIAADGGPSECELNLTSLPGKDCESSHKKYVAGETTEMCVVDDFCYSEPVSPSVVPNSNSDFGDSPVCPDAITGPHTEIVPLNVKDPCHLKDVSSKIEELQYTDMYLYKTCESEDCESVVLSDRNDLGSMEDESHFITTHEIQLTELDHDVDGDFELESCGDVDDDNLVYSFVDYASFDSDETIGADIEDDGSLAPVSSDQALSDNTAPCPASAPVVSTKHEKDRGDLDKCGSSDESLSKAFQNGEGNSAGQIHLSIKTTSRAINKSSSGKETENTSFLAKHEGDWSRYVFKTKDGKGDGTSGRANCFIPAPGRVHFGRKLKGRDFEYSSGASSSVSELDDADKEVRNLTARAFKSLACPYFDAISLSASSESSVSEHGQGISSWSAYTGGHKLLAQKTFQASKNAAGKGIIGYTQAKLNSLFAVNGCFSNAQKASSTAKKVEFKGQLGQEENAIITLAETVNFRCKVNAGDAESERRAKIAETATGSSSIDENTGALPNEQGSEANSHARETAEATDSSHKKAIFASSLLQNIISKKMQFERKMERGGTQTKEHEENAETDAARESRDSPTQNSKTSEAVALEESSRQDAPAPAPETKPEQRSDATSEAARGALLPSENSAFRTWRNGVAGKPDETGKPASCANGAGEINIDLKAGSAKFNRTSQLFVTKIQPQPKGQEPGKQGPSNNSSARPAAERGEGGGWRLRPGNRPGMARGFPTPRSPEIKISVRTVNDNKAKPFNIASLLTPNIGFSSAGQARPGDGCRPRALIASLQGEWAERVPHFMVRDVRDNKYKLLTPIHQVRDMRKLVKSSYHFVSVDSQGKGAAASSGVRGEQTGGERKSMALFSPMVIKCQSVNTNSRPDLNRPGHVLKAFRRRPPVIEEAAEPERSPPPPPPPPAESTPNCADPPRRKAGPPPSVSAPKQSNGDLPETPQKQKQDSVANGNANSNGSANANASGGGDRKPESKAGKAAALEKLQAAVRTMEELYVFDRYEWKRRTQAPQPVTDSHVLSLITREEHGQPGAPAGSDTPYPAERTPEPPARKTPPKSPPPQQRGVFSSRSAPGAGNGRKTPPRATAAANTAPQPHPAPAAAKSFPPKAAKLPVSLKITQPKCAVEEQDVPGGTEAQPGQPTGADCGGNYLTIPVQQPAPGRAQALTQPAPAGSEPGQDRAAARSASPPGAKPGAPDPASSPGLPVAVGTQTPEPPAAAAVYQPTLAIASPAGLAQVMCFPQAVPLQATPPLPAPPPADPAQQTQRKMLLDPTTGQFYLVDTPVSPATRKLYDPETGQYMDVPAPLQPATPVSLPLSPLSPLSPLAAAAALSPSPYATPTYVIYPSFLPSPTCAANTPPSRTLRSRLSTHSDGGGSGGDGNHGSGGGGGEAKPAAGRLGDPAHADSPAARSPQLQSQHAASRGRGSTPDAKPVISITSRQQGPRIVAPPSFDGTTMSFVVEHRSGP